MIDCQSVVLEIQRRRLRWLGHEVRSPRMVFLKWVDVDNNREAKSRQTKEYLTVMVDQQGMGLTWGMAQNVAQDKIGG